MSKTLSLRWLEVFRLIAKSGSIQQVASETGLSISTVSNHLRSLEDALGIALVDHGRRPMSLTPTGEVFSRYVRDGLTVLKRGEAEIRSGNWRHATDLRLALVDDFDNQIAPELIRFLVHALPRCNFRHFTRPSHEIIEKLQEHKLDAGVATRPPGGTQGLVAEGSGWAITTAGCFHRAHRYHDSVRATPFPGRNFVRVVSLFTTEVYPDTTSKLIHKALSSLIRQYFTEPMCKRHLWLKGDFRTMEDQAA